ncbi:hypothetical protein LINGRAHAP2_LOCUS26265 [Linum grandiflorum]
MIKPPSFSTQPALQFPESLIAMSLNVIIWLVLISFCVSASASADNFTAESLDAFLEASAFQTVIQYRRHTGALYQALLPSNFSGMHVSVVRLRSKRLWKIGANFTFFQIPPRTMTNPHVKRLAIVYQDLGNRSPEYYAVPGYSLVTPVVGFQVFDVSNVGEKSMIRKISLDTGGNPVVVKFLAEQGSSRAQCIVFGADGRFNLSDVVISGAKDMSCYGHEDEGHFFSVVVPMERNIDDDHRNQKKKKPWFLWMVLFGTVVGLGVLILLVFVGLMSKKLLTTKKIQVMERQADEDLVLDTTWIRNSKMPCADVTRTQPTIDDFP